MSKTVCPMIARSDWGVGSIQQKGLAHTASRLQSPVGFHGPRTAGWLVFLNGAHRGEDLRLPIGETKVGSSWTSDLVLTGVGIGSQHATIRLGADEGSIASVAANREIKIDNVSIHANTPFRDGTLISLGDIHGVFRFAMQQEPGYRPPEYQKPLSIPLQTAPKVITCGWLVMLRGPQAGQDFRLINGQNRIGSKPGIEVSLIDPHLLDIAFGLTCSPSTSCVVNFVGEGRAFKVNGSVYEKGRLLRDSDVISLDHLEMLVKWY